MNTKTSNKFFYLSDDTQYEFHDEHYCSCPQPLTSAHSVMGALLYELDVLGLQALAAALMGNDEGSFDQWLDDHPATASYGETKQDAIAEAIQQARNDGKLIINHPEAFPWIRPLALMLRGVVGDGTTFDGCLPKGLCECNSTNTQEQTVCHACYARLVSGILHTFIYNHDRASRSEEDDWNLESVSF